ncbi:hypothetical protein J14TS2_15950 [Bacillus sp. J14TS2]|uniref:hypothetical protein n=1 Tax=Bacillus sp. J14TS2 TaxID=2807188 RepID=UPI001B21C1C3|nr:hypothetical protein [Bacillus sp. J14TS2]GIN71120.1 hypothetical protein J14TS2_15950 [Bacillus sp. J14TS2]
MASNTERFDLLKKDPAVDGKDTFNIETMLNDNWDKLEKAAKKSEIDAHTTSKSNPHEVTKSQVGLGNVDNVKQAPKTEFDTHVNNKNNPHGVSSEQINVIKAYTRKVSDPYTSYPLGISTLFVGTGEPQGSWPVYGAVTTIKPYETSQTKGGSTIQFLTPYGTTSSNGGGKIRFRYLPYQETDWSDFVELAVADRVFTYDPNKPSASRSLDGYTTPGVYTLANGDSSSNAPGSSNNMSLLVMRNGDFMTQIVSIPETSGIVRGYTYIRYFGSNKWHSWRALVETPALSLDRVVLGENSSGSGNGAVSLGENAKASGNASVSLGRGANASSNFSTAIGAYSAPLNSNEGTLGGSESNTSNKWLVPGSFTVSGTKNFEIPHPHPDKKDTHRLRHSAVESPTAGDNLYRFTVEAVKDNETTKMLLPEYFQYLNKNVDVYVSPHLHFGRAYGVVENGELKVTCETAGEYKVLVIGTRNDEHQDIQDWSIKGVERENGESWTGETYVFEVEEIKEISEVM